MKIVIVSRCIYPSNAPRPMRATELAKYFATQGHDVTLYGCLGDFDYSDFERKTNVKVKAIGKRLFATMDSSGHKRNNLIDKIGARLLGSAAEFPDIELAFKMKQILKSEPNTDLLITIAIPFPIHWGVAFAKNHVKDFPKTWISDCGDPYMGNSVHTHPSYFQKIEDYWVKQTDFITIPIEEARKAYSQQAQPKLRVIPQGFNFEETPVSEYIPNKIPHFAFAGATYPVYRDPSKFLEYLTTLKEDFRFHVFTPAGSIFHKFKEQLGDKLVLSNYIPRPELLKILSTMDFLVNLKNANAVQSPSKLIDYGIANRPIISIGSDFDEVEEFNEFMSENYQNATKVDIDNYRIENVGAKFLALTNR